MEGQRNHERVILGQGWERLTHFKKGTNSREAEIAYARERRSIPNGMRS